MAKKLTKRKTQTFNLTVREKFGLFQNSRNFTIKSKTKESAIKSAVRKFNKNRGINRATRKNLAISRSVKFEWVFLIMVQKIFIPTIGKVRVPNMSRPHNFSLKPLSRN